MKLGEDGMQPHIQGRAKPADLLKRLTSGKPKKWESRFKALIKPECGGLVVFECKSCKENLSPANPSTTMARHKCTPAALARVRASAVASTSEQQQQQQVQQQQEEEVDCVGQPNKKRKQDMSAYTVTASQHQQFHRLLAIHIIKEEVPFSKLECPVLR